MEEVLDGRVRNGEHTNEPPNFILYGLRRAVSSAAFLFPLLTFAILIHVILRYAFGINLVWLEELHWQLYAYLATFGVVFSFIRNNHVRLDLFHHYLTIKNQLVIFYFFSLTHTLFKSITSFFSKLCHYMQ